MIRNLLSRLLFRKYPLRAAANNYVLRIPRWRIYYRGDRAEVLREYARDSLDDGRTPLLPPGCKVFIEVP